MNLEALKYPIGKYKMRQTTPKNVEEWIETINTFPEKLTKMVKNLSYDGLELQYRPDGWNIKQVVHHLADSHINSFIRCKLILTEDTPTIRPYNQSEWAKTKDATNEEIMDSLQLLEGLHNRWVVLLTSLSPTQLKRRYYHPEFGTERTLEDMIGMYDWHCNHHYAHIQQAIEKDGKF